MEERHERAAAGEPDRRLGGRVPAADDTDPRGAAALGLLWPRGVEDADAFVRLDLRDRKPSVLGAGRENDGARPHLLAALEPDEVMLGAGLERDGAVRRGHAGAELPRLADGANRQLRAADARREAEVVLDPPRRSRLAAESAALDHERVEPLRRAVDGGAEPGRAASDDEQVDRLRLVEVEPDAQRPGHLAGGGIPQLRPSGQAHERDLVVREPGDLGERLRMLGAVGVQPRERQAVAARELDELSRRLGRMRPDDLDTDTVPRLKPLPAGHERPQQQVAERAVLEQERSQLLTLDGDVAHRLGHDGREEDGLSREQVRLAEEAARAVADDLRTGLVEDGRLAFDDRDQRIAPVTDPKEHVADLRAPLLAVLGKQGELSLGEHSPSGLPRPNTIPPRMRKPGPGAPGDRSSRV